MAEEKKLPDEKECTHVCATCASGCGEQATEGVGTLEKTLLQVSEITTEDLLKELENF